MLTVIVHPTSHFFRKGRKKDKTLIRGGKNYELTLENSELVGGQIMRYSESKG